MDDFSAFDMTVVSLSSIPLLPVLLLLLHWRIRHVGDVCGCEIHIFELLGCWDAHACACSAEGIRIHTIPTGEVSEIEVWNVEVASILLDWEVFVPFGL